MLLTSWIDSLCALARRGGRTDRRAARRRFSRWTPTEALEDRTLLTPIVGNLLVDLSNTSHSSTLVLDSVEISGTNTDGAAIRLDNVSGLKRLVIDSVMVSGNAQAGLNISIRNMALDAIVIDTVEIAENNGSGVVINLDNATVGTLNVFESSIDGVQLVGTNSLITKATINGNDIVENGAGSGLLVGMDHSQLPDLTIANNTNISAQNGGGVQFSTESTPLPNVNIIDNTISGSGNGDGIQMAVTDGNVAGRITGNEINGNSRNGISVTPSATPAFVAANGGPLTVDFQSQNADGRKNELSGNTVSGNSGNAGINADIPGNTRLLADIEANTISDNSGFGVGVRAKDGSFDVNVGGTGTDPLTDASVDGNTIDNNRGAGVSVLALDTSGANPQFPNALKVQNNIITRTQDDGVGLNAYIGDGIHVQLAPTNLLVDATVKLTAPVIEGNVIGTDRQNTTGLGNAGRGISVNLQDDTEISDMDIDNNVIVNNGGTGLQVLRLDDSVLSDLQNVNTNPNNGPLTRAVNIRGNVIDNNGQNPTGPVPRPEPVFNTGDGIELVMRNGELTLNSFHVADNQVTRNNRGVSLEVGADGRLLADLEANQISTNRADGVFVGEEINFPTDRRRVGGTWTKNSITDNGGHGVQLAAQTGGTNPLAIGLAGIDPNDGRNRGNVITGNTLDGIEINDSSDNVNNTIPEGNASSWIINNDISENGTGGVDINSLRMNKAATLTGNIIINNGGDGVELLTGNIIVSNLTAMGNTIKLNAGRGVDILNRDRAVSNVKFGDGSVQGTNQIVENNLEGFYVVNTASPNQTQDVPSSAPLLADGSLNVAPDVIMNLDRNFITGNGKDSPIDGSGLVIRVGTSNAGTSAFSSGPGLGTETGVNGNGRVNARVVNNTFEGNFGVDVLIESFVSTVTPPATGGQWSATQFQVNGGFRRDPLARLNLIFTGNSGNALDVTRLGAFYDNDEQNFKSRTFPGRNAPDPFGPFTDGDRRRNAQRLAARDEDVNGNGVLDPGEDTNGNGTIDFIAPLTGPDNGSFLFDGIGQSTFRVAPGFDVIDGVANDGQNFTSGDGFIVDSGPVLDFSNGNSLSAAASNANGVFLPGTILGELPYGWGLWTPNQGGQSFVDPFQDVPPLQPNP